MNRIKDDIVRESKGVENTPSKLYENKMSLKKPSKRSSIKRLSLVQIALCIKCLDELRKQQVTDGKVYGQKPMENTVSKLA